MSQCSQHGVSADHLVGDPVDVTTGALTDRTLDFRLSGPLELEWRRYYDSAKVDRAGALGWGHTHEYDRWLIFDADGLRYLAPVGVEVGFPPLEQDGGVHRAGGLVLERVSPGVFNLHAAQGLTYEFRFVGATRVAPVAAIRRGVAQLLFRHGTDGALTEIVDSAQRRIAVVTGAGGRIQSLVLKAGESHPERQLLHCEYDGQGNLVRFQDPYGNPVSFRYDSSRRMTARTDRRGYTFSFEYDDEGRCIRSAGQDGMHEVRLRYLAAQRMTIVTQADGGEWKYCCDESGRLSQVIDPLGGIKQFISNPAGQVTEVIDADGDKWRRVYGQSGASIGEIDPCGRLNASARAALRKEREELAMPEFVPPVPNLPTVFLARVPVSWGHTHFYSNPFRWEFGDRLAIHASVRPLHDELSVSGLPGWSRPSVVLREPPSAQGEPLPPPQAAPFVGKAIFPPGIHTRDVLGTLTRVKDVDGGLQEWSYDANGNIVRYRDGDRQVWQYEYASWNQLAREVSPAGRVTEYVHTCLELLAQTKDARGSVGQYGYDLRGRLSEVVHGPEWHDQFRYDSAARTVSRQDARDAVRLKIRLGPGNQPAEVEDHEGRKTVFEYGPAGLCQAAENEHGRAEFAYDELGNLARDFRDGAGVQREFDAFDLTSSVLFGRFAVHYQSSPGGLTVMDPTGRRQEFKFLGHGLVWKVLSNQTEEVSQYQFEGRCLMKVLRSGAEGQRIWSRQFVYTSGGHLVRVEDNQGGVSEYSYDADGRLVSSRTGGRADAFTHDAAGNLIAKPGLSGARFGAANEMLGEDGVALRYDGSGCLSSISDRHGETVFRHDPTGRLVERISGEGRWSSKYDALGRRIFKSWPGGSTEFFWDGERLAAEIRDGQHLRIFVYAHHRARVPFMFVDYASRDADPAGGKRYYVFTNQIGAPVRIEDDDAVVVWHARYEPFGEATIHCQPDFPGFNLRFPGHYADPETGLHYNRFRYYHPVWGRYLEPDPVDVLGGINLYACTSDPLSEVDVDGRCPKRTPPLDPNEESKDRAARMAARIRNELDQNPNQWGFTPHDNITYAVMVVRMADGSTRTVVTANGNRQSLHNELNGVVASNRFVAPENNAAGETGHHAEQRAMAWARENSTNPDPSQRVVAIEAISPTRPCCPGCTAAIQRRGDSNLDVVQTPSGVDTSTVR